MRYSYSRIKKNEKELGTPFYVLYLERFIQNYNDFLGAFKKIYNNTVLAYSYKTNYIPDLCKAINGLGAYAEVVSDMEYELALRIGVDPKKIIFNGPLKEYQIIETALLNESLLHLDSFYEISILKELTNKYIDKHFNVGIRCSFQYDNNVEQSRFGFDKENGSFEKALREIRKLKNVSVNGLHCHFIASGKSTQAYNKIINNMLQLYKRYFLDSTIKYLDIGGGFFSRMPLSLQKQFDYPVPNYEDYAHAIASELKKFFSGIKNKPVLILEPGIALAADTMDFVAKVIDVKKVKGKTLALVNGSIYNVKPTMNTKNLPMKIVSRRINKSKRKHFDIVGYSCMENDYLYLGYWGHLSKGDYIIFNNVGAYTVVLKPPFIKPSPPIVRFKKGKYKLIRREETFEDIFLTYEI
ncbi:MAG: decarboxylase [bacterium]